MADAAVHVVADGEALAQAAATLFVDLVTQAVTSRGAFSVALSGGTTPGALFELLAEEPYRSRLPWAKIHLFWADERSVPPDDPGSNYRLAHETLIARAPIIANCRPSSGTRSRASIWCCWGWDRTDIPPHSFPARTHSRKLSDRQCRPRLTTMGVPPGESR